MEKEELNVDSSTEYKKICFTNYEVAVLFLKSVINDSSNYHVSVECLDVNTNEIYGNLNAKFFENENDAKKYFDELYSKYSSIKEIELEEELKMVK